MMGLGMGVGILVLLAFWAILIVGAVWLVKALFASGEGRPAGQPPSGETPRQILDRRYARGEIGREEYETMRRDLTC